MILSDTESLRRKLDFLLHVHTEGSGQLNISIQLLASLDVVLNILMNATTIRHIPKTCSRPMRGGMHLGCDTVLANIYIIAIQQ